MNSQTAPVGKGDILIVDDKPDNLRMLSKMLQSRGYYVRKAINGQLALQGVKMAPPDLILLDINMPTINGYEVCQELKSSEHCDIPVIFISALDEVLDKVKAFQVGGVDYITKPFYLEEVLARVETHLNQRQLSKQLQEQNARLELEITERQRAEEQIYFLLSTIQAISESIDLHSALKVTLCQVCETIGWDFGEAWIPNSDATVLECSPSWYARDPNLESFINQREPFTLAPNIGLPGRVWLSKQTEWIVDSINPYQGFLRSQIALDVGLRTELGVPILFNDQVLAILVLFKKVKSEPEQRLIELVNAVATQLGSLIQRVKAEAALVKANQELERLATVDET